MKRFILIGILGLFCSAAIAQNRTVVSYSLGLPLGNVGDFISPLSFRGVTLDYHGMINDFVGVGFTVGLNVFYEERARATYVRGTESLTGKQYRYSNHVPILFSAAYYLNPDDTWTPFASLGIGTMYSRRNTDMGIYSLEQEAWNFLLSPEVGAMFTVNYDHAIVLSAQYYNGFKAGNELDKAQTYLAFKLGYEF